MFCLKRQSVPRSKQFVWVIRASQSVLYGAKVAVCYEVHTEITNTLCGRNLKF
jgi:hypothetical protein